METTQVQPTENIPWADIYFSAEANNEPFTNMNIVTAKSELLISARNHALQVLLKKNESILDDSIDQLAQKWVNEHGIKVFEQAHINAQGVQVCLDVDVIDDDSIWKALDLVYKAVSNGGTWISDTPIKYNWKELTE